MCFLAVECVLLPLNVFLTTAYRVGRGELLDWLNGTLHLNYTKVRMCSLSTECVPLPYCLHQGENVFSFNRMCFLAIECVLLLFALELHQGGAGGGVVSLLLVSLLLVSLLLVSLLQVEQCGNGAAYCQLFDAIYPGTVECVLLLG